jgi:hypothetical protein
MKYIQFVILILITTGCIPFGGGGMDDVDCGEEIPFLTIGDKSGLNVKTINKKLEYKITIGRYDPKHDAAYFDEYDNGEAMYVCFDIERDTNNNNIYFNINRGCGPYLIPKETDEQLGETYCKAPTYDNRLGINRIILYSVNKNDIINRNSVTTYTNQKTPIIRDSVYSLKTLNSDIESQFDGYDIVLSSQKNDTLYLPIGITPTFCNTSLGWIECMFKGDDFYINEVVMAPHKYY